MRPPVAGGHSALSRSPTRPEAALTAPVTGDPTPASPPPSSAAGSAGAIAGMAASVADRAPDVEILDVTKRFGEVLAVDQMTLRIARGEFYSFLGPSGCGKTTTLRMIAGFEQPTAGEILLEGQSIAGVPPYRRNVNTVFQHYALFPHMDVAQNVGYGLRQKGIKGDEEKRRVAEALGLVRLDRFASRRTWEMSGGQQQRVALARALINHPTVLLLDEPLGALDRQLRHDMQLELKALQREVGITFVYVTHDQEEALTMSDVIVVMKDGRIQQQGRPEELYQRPTNRFVAGFIGSSNFLEATLIGHDRASGKATVETPEGLRLTGPVMDPAAQPTAGQGLVVAIRPERFRIGPARSTSGGADEPGGGAGWVSVPGRVTQGTYLGDQTEYRVEAEGLGELVIRRQNETLSGEQVDRIYGPGEAIAVTWHEDANLMLLS
jgi:spermidine/putrescine transport system ATP-binding protein